MNDPVLSHKDLNTVMVVGAGIWGKGGSVAEAVRNSRARKTDALMGWIGTDDISCDDWGSVRAKYLVRLGQIR